MVQSLIIPERYPDAMYRYFGLLILDEVHQMAAECFVRSCQMFPAKYRLGFSATPNRQDGKTKLLHWHIGPTMVVGKIVAMTPKVLVRQTGWHIPTKRKLIGNAWQHIPIPHAPGRMTLVTKALASNDPRNLESINFIKQAYDKDRRILIMSDLIGHLQRLFQMLTGAGIPGHEIGYYIGGMKKTELSSTKQRRVVLATYQMCSTGTDCPVWDTLVMVTPRANVKQSIGRVLRAADGKRQPVILDLVDANSIFQSFHLSRVKQYHSIGAEIVRV
jgi:superfamily II DNA or RNA helicase